MLVALDAFSLCNPAVNKNCIANPAMPMQSNKPHCTQLVGSRKPMLGIASRLTAETIVHHVAK